MAKTPDKTKPIKPIKPTKLVDLDWEDALDDDLDDDLDEMEFPTGMLEADEPDSEASTGFKLSPPVR